MSKNPDFDSPKNIEQYNGSSSGAVWIILVASSILAVIALIGTSSIT